MWVIIHFEDRDPIKWTIEERLGSVPPPGKTKNQPKGKNNSSTQKKVLKNVIVQQLESPGQMMLILMNDGSDSALRKAKQGRWFMKNFG